MRWWCAGEFKQRPRDSVEKPSAHDEALVVGSTDPALFRILLLGDGSGSPWKLDGVPRRLPSPWSAAVPLPLSPWPAAAPLSPWPAVVPLSPWHAAASPGVFHGNFGLTDAHVARALKYLTGITDFHVAWESRRTDAPAREANWGMLHNYFSVFVSNGPKRVCVCVQTTVKGTVRATLLENAVPPCSHFGLIDAEGVAKRLTGIVHLYAAWECRRTDAPAREANSTMLGNDLSVFVSNCPKRLHVCLQTTGMCTAALVDHALPPCHFDLTHHENIAILKPLRDALSIPVPSCSKRAQVCVHTGPASQNFGAPLAVDFTRTARAALLDGIHPLEDDLRGQVSYPEPASEKNCAPSVGQCNSVKMVSYPEPAGEKICSPSIRQWNSIKKVILILVIFSLITGVDSSSVGTSSMNNLCPKRDPASYFMSLQRRVCPIIEIPSAHRRQLTQVVPGPSQQQPQQHRKTKIEVISTLAAYFVLLLCCVAPWVSVKNLEPGNGRIHRFLFFIRIEPVNMWRYTILASINFYASMISYGVGHGVAPKQHESTWLRNFTWLQFTTTIANAVYCFAFVLLLMWLLHRERTIFQEANLVRSCLCSTVFTVLIFGIHIMLFFLIHGSTSKEIFFERIAFVCIILMYIFRLFTMLPTMRIILFKGDSGILLICITEANNWYKWGVIFMGISGRILELITWIIWVRKYDGMSPLIIAE